MLCWLAVPGEDYAAAVAADVDVTAYSVAELDEIAAAAGGRRPARVQLKVDTGLSRGGAAARRLARRWSRAAAAAERGRAAAGHRHLVALRLQRRARPPGQRRPGGRVPRRARAVAAAAGLRPRGAPPRQLGGRALRPSPASTWCGAASRRTASTPAPGVHRRDLGLRAGDDRRAPAWRWSSASPPAPASPTGTPGSPTATPRSASSRSGTATGVPRARRQPAPRCWVGGARRPVARPGLHGPVRRRPRRRPPPPATTVVLFGPGHGGEPTAQDWAEALRHHQLRDRDPDRRPAGPSARGQEGPMSGARHGRRVIGAAAGAAGLAAAAGAGVGSAPAQPGRSRTAAPATARRSARCAATPLHVDRRRRRRPARRGRRGRRRPAAARRAADDLAPSSSRTASRSTSTAGTSSARPTAARCAPSSTTSAPTAAPRARRRSTPPSSSSASDLLRSSSTPRPTARSCWSATRWAG